MSFSPRRFTDSPPPQFYQGPSGQEAQGQTCVPGILNQEHILIASLDLPPAPVLVSGTRHGINSVASKDRDMKANPPRCVCAGEAQLGSPSHVSPWQHGSKPSSPAEERGVVFILVSLRWRKYLGAGDGEGAGGLLARLSSRRGQKDGCIHRCCCR